MIPRTKTAAVVLWKVEYSWSLQASATRPGMLMIGTSANDRQPAVLLVAATSWLRAERLRASKRGSWLMMGSQSGSIRPSCSCGGSVSFEVSVLRWIFYRV